MALWARACAPGTRARSALSTHMLYDCLFFCDWRALSYCLVLYHTTPQADGRWLLCGCCRHSILRHWKPYACPRMFVLSFSQYDLKPTYVILIQESKSFPIVSLWLNWFGSNLTWLFEISEQHGTLSSSRRASKLLSTSMGGGRGRTGHNFTVSVIVNAKDSNRQSRRMMRWS